MRVLECNKGNWSGEKIQVRIKNDGTFEVYDNKFQLVIKEEKDPEMKKFWSRTCELFFIERNGRKVKIAFGNEEPSKYPTAENKTVWYLHESDMEGISRESYNDPFPAAIGIICSTF